MNLLTRLRTWINRFDKKAKVYPHSYMVNVLITHPRLTNSLVNTPVVIDAHSSEHARRQLRKELKVVVGRAVVVPKRKMKTI